VTNQQILIRWSDPLPE